MRISIAATIALLIPVAAQAQEIRPSAADPQVLEARVNLADLDMSRPSGAEAAMGRIHVAADRVCGPSVSPADLSTTQWRRACVRRATLTAVSEFVALRSDAPAKLAAK